MQSDLVVVQSPSGDRLTGLLQRLKPVLIQTFIPERAIEALDVSFLRRAARLDQDMLVVMLLCPIHECPASKLWPVVSSNRLRIAPKRGGPMQQTSHVIFT